MNSSSSSSAETLEVSKVLCDLRTISFLSSRSHFARRFGAPSTVSLLDPSSPPSLSQRVVNMAQELRRTNPAFRDATSDDDDKELFDAAVRALQEQGVTFERRKRASQPEERGLLLRGCAPPGRKE